MGVAAAGVNDDMILKYALEYFLAPEKTSGHEHTYGDRLKSQWDPIVEKLRSSPGTRRAVALIARVEDISSQYPPCVRELNFFFKAPDYKRLHTTVFMRSWDAFGASNPDMGSFQLAAEMLASRLGVPTGTLTVLATNAHVYEEMIDTIRDMLKETKPAPKPVPTRGKLAGECKDCGGDLIYVRGTRMTVKMCLDCDRDKVGVRNYLQRTKSYRKGYRFERRIKRVFEGMGARVFRCAGSKPLDLVIVWPDGVTEFVECKSYPNPWSSDYKMAAEISKIIRRTIIFVHPTSNRRELIFELIGPNGLLGIWGDKDGKEMA